MRAGAFISAFAHAGVLAWVLLGTPKPFNTANGEPVTVDLVPSDEVPQVTKSEPPEPPPELPKPEAEKPLLIPPRETVVAEKPQPGFAPAQPQAATPKPAAPTPQASPKPTPQQAASAQQPPSATQQPTAQPQTAQQRTPAAPPPPPAQAPQPPPQEVSIFDAASIPKLLDIAPTQAAVPASKAPEYDMLSDTAAALSHQEVATFKTTLKKCLKLPAGVDAARELKVVMRVFLRPDGGLASDPMLVAAPAAREGPALVQAATQAFKACQPYALPPEKYNEWKTLDITLSPRDMAGG